MYSKSSIYKLCLCLVLSSMLVMSGCNSKGGTTIYNPDVEKNETNGWLEISRIVLTDTATVLYFDLYHSTNPGSWYSIAEESVLQGSNKTYKIIGSDGIELGKRIQGSEPGHLAFILYFEPVDKSEKTVDFKEGDEPGHWRITGIKLYKVKVPKPTGAIKCTLKGEVIDRPNSHRLMLMKEGDDPRIQKMIYITINNGKFEYVLNCDYEESYSLIFQDEWSNSMWRPVEFISENGVINFTLHPMDRYGENKVEGSKLSQDYSDYKWEIIDKHFDLGIEKVNNEIIESIKERLSEEEYREGFRTGENNRLHAQLVWEDSLYQEWHRWKVQYISERQNIAGYSVLVSETRRNTGSFGFVKDFSLFAEVFQTVFEPKYPNHPYTAKMIDLLTSSSLKAGGSFIDFTAVDFTGKQVKLSEQIAGKPAVLHLWASWCGPCRTHGKELIPVFEEFRDKGFIVVGVAREKRISTAEAAVKQDKYPWENLVEIDDAEQIWNKYGIGNAGGSDFLIDENGIIVAVAPSIGEIRDFLKNR